MCLGFSPGQGCISTCNQNERMSERQHLSHAFTHTQTIVPRFVININKAFICRQTGCALTALCISHWTGWGINNLKPVHTLALTHAQIKAALILISNNKLFYPEGSYYCSKHVANVLKCAANIQNVLCLKRVANIQHTLLILPTWLYCHWTPMHGAQWHQVTKVVVLYAVILLKHL